MMRELSGKEPDHSLAVSEVVARGAALHAGIAAARAGTSGLPQLAEDELSSVIEISVIGHSLGVEVKHRGERISDVLIAKNTQLPASATRTYHTAKRLNAAFASSCCKAKRDKPRRAFRSASAGSKICRPTCPTARRSKSAAGAARERHRRGYAHDVTSGAGGACAIAAHRRADRSRDRARSRMGRLAGNHMTDELRRDSSLRGERLRTQWQSLAAASQSMKPPHLRRSTS